VKSAKLRLRRYEINTKNSHQNNSTAECNGMLRVCGTATSAPPPTPPTPPTPPRRRRPPPHAYPSAIATYIQHFPRRVCFVFVDLASCDM
jgi:hypothetical protein